MSGNSDAPSGTEAGEQRSPAADATHRRSGSDREKDGGRDQGMPLTREEGDAAEDYAEREDSYSMEPEERSDDVKPDGDTTDNEQGDRT